MEIFSSEDEELLKFMLKYKELEQERITFEN